MSDNSIDNAQLKSLQSEMHVWFCNPESIQDEARLKTYLSVLSAQERERYSRFHFEKDKHTYLVSHALLRFALSKYADVSPAEWIFSVNDSGKPALIEQGDLPRLQFNLSHTDGLSTCIISLGTACGVDAEHIHRKNNINAVAQRMFADEELAVMEQEEHDPSLFYDFWTLREAYVKALGTGLAGSSKDYYFTKDKVKSAAAIHFRNPVQAEKPLWQFKIFQPTKMHRLAVAYQSSHSRWIEIQELVP